MFTFIKKEKKVIWTKFQLQGLDICAFPAPNSYVEALM